MTKLPLTLRQATPDELDLILELLGDSIRWLQGMGIDQWAKPWPDEEDRTRRIHRDVSGGKIWLALDGTAVAGTITIDPTDDEVWPAQKRGEKAVYVRRVIVRRSYAGLGLGARLVDWAADVAWANDARWIRIDVWTTNRQLHNYYRRQGFRFCGLADDPEYSSRALFERGTGSHRSEYQAMLRPA